MLKFNCNVQNRKDLVKRLADLTNMESRYMGAPNFAYKIGPYTVECDGTLAVDEADADMKVLSTFGRRRNRRSAPRSPEPPADTAP